MQTSSSWISHFIVPCTKNMASQYCKQSSCNQFHETEEQQSNQHAFSKVVHENELESRHSRQRIDLGIDAWSSSSSLSSLSTGSLFSLSDSMSLSKRYKTTGTMFSNLDLVPLDPDVDPKPYACYNCWQFDHECHSCPEVKILYCRNCGRRGVVMNECPRCAKAYIDFLDRLNGQCRAFFGGVQEPEEKTKLVQDMQLDVIKEEGGDEECWDDCVDENYKTCEAAFSDYLEKKEIVYQYDEGDWDNYESPRINIIEKTSKVHSLFATKAEVAQLKNDNWDNFGMDNYSYSWRNHVNANSSATFNWPEENKKCEDENWDSFTQDASKDLWPSSKENNQIENERAEHESECWSNHNDDNFKSRWHESTEEKISCSLIPAGKLSLEDSINTWSNVSVEDVFSSPQTNFGEQNEVDFQNKNVQCVEEDLNDLEDYKSLDTSFCKEYEIDHLKTTLDIDEDYWTDFDDEYESLEASFAEDYKSLDTTADDENDNINILIDIPKNNKKLVFCENFDSCGVVQSDKLFPSIKSEKSDKYFQDEQSYEVNVYEFNSLENSVDDQSEEPYDVDNYEDLIVDEDERSEPPLSTGHAIQEFLVLLDSVKHLPIQTQNLAVLHYISKCKEISWQSQMQSRM